MRQNKKKKKKQQTPLVPSTNRKHHITNEPRTELVDLNIPDVACLLADISVPHRIPRHLTICLSMYLFPFFERRFLLPIPLQAPLHPTQALESP